MAGRNKIILLSLIIMITLFISGCGEEKKCANQIQSFVSACNELDAEGILSCMDPSIADPIRITFGVIGTLTGKELNDVLDGIIHILVKGLQLFNDEIEMEQIFSSMSIEVEKIKMTTGSNSITVTLKGEGEEKDRQKTVLVPSLQAFVELVQEKVDKEGLQIELSQESVNPALRIADTLFSMLPTILLINHAEALLWPFSTPDKQADLTPTFSPIS